MAAAKLKNMSKKDNVRLVKIGDKKGKHRIAKVGDKKRPKR